MEKADILAALCQAPLFAALTRPQAEGLLTAGGRVMALTAGARADIAPDTVLGVLLTGRAQILSADSERTVILRTLLPPDVFGAAALFCRTPAPLSRVEALADSEILLIPRGEIRALMAENPRFLDAYLAFLAGRVQFLNRKIRCFTAGTAERKLALWLAGEEHDTVYLPTSLSALSDMLGIGRASLYRAFDKLTADGVIAKNGREITVLARDALNAI